MAGGYASHRGLPESRWNRAILGCLAGMTDARKAVRDSNGVLEDVHEDVHVAAPGSIFLFSNALLLFRPRLPLPSAVWRDPALTLRYFSMTK